MVLLLILGVLSLVGFLVYRIFNYNDGGMAIGVFCAICLVVFLIAIPIARYDTKIKIAQFQETQRTLEDARVNKSISPFELAAIQKEVIGQNTWLVEAKIWKNNIFVGVFTHPSILKLDPIK